MSAAELGAAGPRRAELIEELNRLMAEETEACLRYFQMRFRVRGRHRRRAERFFEEAIKETLEHADAIARRIDALGHVPMIKIELTLSGEVMRAADALAEALDVEQQALDAYKEFLPRVIGDRQLEPFIRQQIAVETEHVEELRAVISETPSLRVVAKTQSS